MKVTVTAARITRVVDGATVFVGNGETVEVGDREGAKLVALGVAAANVPDAAPVATPGNAPVTETTTPTAPVQP